MLNASLGGAPASWDVRLGGASAPLFGSLGGAAGRFDFDRATSDSHWSWGCSTAFYVKLSSPTSSLFAWRPLYLHFILGLRVLVLLFGPLVFVGIALPVCVLLMTRFLGLVPHVTSDQILNWTLKNLFHFSSSTAQQDSFVLLNVCLILYLFT